MLTLTDEEIADVTGYSQPSKQLVELRRQGFYRARQSPTSGRVILERAHYEAVTAGEGRPKQSPRLHLVRTI